MSDQSNTLQEIESKLFMHMLSDLIAKLSRSRQLDRCWKLIEEDYSDSNLNLEEAARLSGISRNHLNHRLRQMTSFTFHQLLTRYRLLRVVAMMADENYSLLEIALENGFGSLRSFQRNFRTIVGESAQRFRKRLDF